MSWKKLSIFYLPKTFPFFFCSTEGQDSKSPVKLPLLTHKLKDEISSYKGGIVLSFHAMNPNLINQRVYLHLKVI